MAKDKKTKSGKGKGKGKGKKTPDPKKGSKSKKPPTAKKVSKIKKDLKAEKSLMRISAAAKAAGVSNQTVEYYMMIGLISPIRLKDRFGRFFDEGLIRRIKLIRELNETGYTLRDIRDIYIKDK